MYKTLKSSRSGKALNARYSEKYKDHDIAGTDPNKKQFEPTDANPVRQHAQMAGDDSIGGYLADTFSAAGKAVKKMLAEKPKDSTSAATKRMDDKITAAGG